MNKDAILALIPAWNEASRIQPVLEGVRAYLPVLVVDDGSTDDTAALSEAAGATVVRHEQNRGKGAALDTGYAWALAQGYDAVLTLDADGQHDPADLPKFLAAYQAGAGDLIIGRRDFSQMPFPRRIVNPVGSWLLSLALGVRIFDNQSGYRLYTRRVLEGWRSTGAGFEQGVEIIIRAVRKGLRIGWVEIRTIYDTGKKSYFAPIKDTVRFLQVVWRAWRLRVKDRRRIPLVR
ncbi:MAG: glycosyltransferase family 2 protein [Anaerolineae bacterium]